MLPASVLNGQREEVTLLRNRAGHYVADGEINGRAVMFLVDTGATWVVVPSALARQLRLERAAPITVQTANGPSTGYQTRLAQVRLGAIEIRDIGAVVTDGMSGNTVLLGMNFLQRLELTQRDNRLTLRLATPQP